MENKIGDIVTFPNGRKAKVVESAYDCCDGCILNFRDSYICRDMRTLELLGDCFERTDGKEIIYEEIKED